MDFGSGAGGSGRDDNGQDSPESEGLKRKWSDLEASMKAMKDAFVQENAEKSARIRRLMEDNVRLEETVLRLENSPFQGPIGPMERPNPFAVFPAEVWEAIIEQMDGSSDLEMLCLAFPPLKSLVKKNKKTIFLFENILPFLCEHLKLEEINNCRLVCQKWNQDLCTLMANWNAPNLLPNASCRSYREFTSETRVPDHPVPSKLLRAYLFQDHLKLQMFLNEMADHPSPRNPFFGRFLRLRLNGRIEIKDFWKSVLEMVEKFGEHIWNLEVRRRGGNGFQSQTSFYEVLRKTLVYLPNLRYLTVDLRFPDHELDEMRMATTIGFYPLPSLPHLQNLDLDLCSNAGMSTAFSSLCSKQIYQLKLRHHTFGDLEDELLRGLHNLEHLYVALDPIIDMPRLLKLPSLKLKKLCFHSIYFSSPPVLINSGQVASLFEKFTRLEHLDLTRCDVKPSSSASLRVQFSSLKTLEIEAGVNGDDLQHNLDFLLWFPSLKHLVIFADWTGTSRRIDVNEVDKHSTLKIRNYVFDGLVLDSNIWTLIPSLELLEIMNRRDLKFTRQMFESRGGL